MLHWQWKRMGQRGLWHHHQTGIFSQSSPKPVIVAETYGQLNFAPIHLITERYWPGSSNLILFCCSVCVCTFFLVNYIIHFSISFHILQTIMYSKQLIASSLYQSHTVYNSSEDSKIHHFWSSTWVTYRYSSPVDTCNISWDTSWSTPQLFFFFPTTLQPWSYMVFWLNTMVLSRWYSEGFPSSNWFTSCTVTSSWNGNFRSPLNMPLMRWM